MGDELKPCPFCESASLRVASQDHDGRHGEETLWWIECSECSSAGPALPSRYEATEAWNRPTARAEAAEQRAAAAEAEVARLRADRAVVTTLAIMALGPETHDVLLCSPVPLLGALRPECLAALPDGAQSEDVAAYVREMCGRMLAEAQPAEVPNG